MSELYDKTNKTEIIAFAKHLKNKSLRDVCGATAIEHGYEGKGHFGQILEDFYFQYKPNSDSEPDFKEVGLELKSSPLKRLKNKEYRAKERLVLNVINYIDEVNYAFESSSFWRKNAHLLLVFYLHQASVDVLDLVIRLVDEWQFPEDDLEIIKQDWALIQRKIIDGKAHELSEGDTFYLGACTKGSKGGNPRPQPNSVILAKQRAFSLKQGYVNHIVATISHGSSEVYGKLVTSSKVLEKESIESMVLAKFQPYYNKTVSEIEEAFKLRLNKNAKNFYANLTNAMLGIELGRKIEEFEKADIKVKTVRLKSNNLPKEQMSFPAFKYKELVNEHWDDSQIKEILEHKFLFVFFQERSSGLVLKKVKFWNMPFSDLQEVKKVWLETKRIIKLGHIVKEIKDEKRYTNFPNKKFNHVSHVRPHANDANDTYPLPFKDLVTAQFEYTKHGFWLNDSYIRDAIYFKKDD